jgi:protein-tyrosine phosphatase
MPYTDYNWITERFAIGGRIPEPQEDFPFDAVMSLETHAPPALRELTIAGHVDYRWFSIIDGYSWEGHDEIIRRFDAAADQIHAWVESDRTVLVHCTAGVSRSVTAVIWYLMRHKGYTWTDALALVRRYRPQANPNPRFEIPLRTTAGEELTREWMEERIRTFCLWMEEHHQVDVDPAIVWQDLERQGTMAYLSAASVYACEEPA